MRLLCHHHGIQPLLIKKDKAVCEGCEKKRVKIDWGGNFFKYVKQVWNADSTSSPSSSESDSKPL